MVKEVVGFRTYEFTDTKTKDVVSGCNLYLQWTEDEIEGLCCESVSVSTKKLDGYVPRIGDEVRIGYNKYGKCDFIMEVG